MTNGPAEVQIRVIGSDLDSMDFTATLVPLTRLRCRECDIRMELPFMQARAAAVDHNKKVHPPRHRALAEPIEQPLSLDNR